MKLLITLLLTLSLTACTPLTLVVGVTPGDQTLEKQTVRQDPKTHSRSADVMIIDVSGVILNANEQGLLREGLNPVSTFVEQLDQAATDDKVKAVILRINSPGGGVTASDIMYREVLRFKQQTDKPVIALLMDVAASGGYYLACSADEIVAYPTSITGSIGVIVQTISVKPALNRIGIQPDSIVSGPNKAAGSPLDNLTPDQRATLQAIVDDFYLRFQNVVKTSRPNIDPQQFDMITDGRVVTGEQAVQLNLADHLGDLHTAFDRAKANANLGPSRLILYKRPLSYVPSPYATTPHSPNTQTQLNLLQLNLNQAGLPTTTSPNIYYLWTGN